MTKNVATAFEPSVGELIAKLGQLGYALSNPNTGAVHGFTAAGDGPVFLAPDKSSEFLVEGNGVLLWRTASDSLYLSLIMGKPRISFDGLSKEGEQALCAALASLGINFVVTPEDTAYEA